MQKNKIQFITGDATNPKGVDTRIIAHICNDVNGWGRGFVLALSKRWKSPEKKYHEWAVKGRSVPFELGSIQIVKVEKGVYVANMIAQHDIRSSPDGTPPIRYEALRTCLAKLSMFAKSKNASVHMPRIGAGLAGGFWPEIEKIIEETLVAENVPVTVYTLEQAQENRPSR